MAGEPRSAAGDAEPLRDRSSVDLVRGIGDDLGRLVRMEVTLARQELERSLGRAVHAVAAIATAAVFVVVALVLIGFAGIYALDGALPDWAAALVVGAAAVGIAGAALAFARDRLRRASVVPERATEAVKEDIEWAKTRLKP